MKKLLLFLLLLPALAYSQTTNFGGIGLRVNDTTAYQLKAATSHANGYYDFYFNNQATNDHWDVWNGTSYDHIFSFLSLGAGDFLPLLLAGNTTIDADGNDLTISDIGSLTLNILNDFNLNIGADFKVNGVAPTSGEFLGHDGWAVPAGTGGGGGGSAVLDVSTNDVGNVGAGEDVLWSYTLPGDSLSEDGQGLFVRVAGSSAINGNTKRVRLKMGDDLMVDPGAGNLTLTWTLDCQVIRTSGTTLKSNCQVVTIGAGQTHTVLTDITETLSGDVVFQLTGEAVSNNDIVKESVTVIRMEGGGSGGSVGGGDLSLSDFVTSETPSGTVNGINVTFTTAFTPAGFFHLYVDGLLQKEGGGNDFTRTGPTITFVIAPLTGSIITTSYVK